LDASTSKTVLIENEFGEIGIDGGFLKEAGIEIKEMNSGCICLDQGGLTGTQESGYYIYFRHCFFLQSESKTHLFYFLSYLQYCQ